MQMFQLVVWIWIGVGVVTFLFLRLSKIRAPYGRHSSLQWGPTISNKWGWFWMEVPALLIFPLITAMGPREKDLLSWILIGLWSIHYINRAFIFPFRIKTKGKKMPLFIAVSGLLFNIINGIINGYYLGFLAPKDAPVTTIFVMSGILIFFIGFYINNKADSKLIALRNGNSGYKIPKGWLFDKISCPNHFGEIIEWTGFAIAAWNLPAVSFAIWTFCNLAPRAANHHSWYKDHFKDYPISRKALIPYIW
jgi:hypothetical protein